MALPSTSTPAGSSTLKVLGFFDVPFCKLVLRSRHTRHDAHTTFCCLLSVVQSVCLLCCSCSCAAAACALETDTASTMAHPERLRCCRRARFGYCWHRANRVVECAGRAGRAGRASGRFCSHFDCVTVCRSQQLAVWSRCQVDTNICAEERASSSNSQSEGCRARPSADAGVPQAVRGGLVPAAATAGSLYSVQVLTNQQALPSDSTVRAICLAGGVG